MSLFKSVVRVSALFIFILGFAFSCSSGSFTGSSANKPAKKIVTQPTPTTQPTPITPQPASSSTPTTTTNNGPIIPPGTFDSIINFLGGALTKLKDLDIDVGDTEISFGQRKAFHIGDGNMDATSCKLQLNVHSVKGVKYFFEFNVLEDDTEIGINADTLCGLDYESGNNAYLLAGQNTLQSYNLNAGQESINFDNIRLNRGKYAILFESQAYSGSANDDGIGAAGDHDDYIVGGITVRSLNGKKIEPGEVSFE